jgi:transketolase
MRRALNDFLMNKVAQNDKIVFLTGDLGFGVFDEFKEKFPKNYINAGIAESNMIAVAAGLSASGFHPIVYSIASFATSRPYEFIKVLAGYNDFGMTIIGAGGGLAYSLSGGTHHSLDDFSLMLGIPGVGVYSPAGPREMTDILNLCVGRKGTNYIRIGKFGERDVFEGAVTAQPQQIVTGQNLAILTHGNLTVNCLEAIKKYREKSDDLVSLYHFSSIRPLDEKSVIRTLGKYESLLVVEEHYLHGGLYNELLLLAATNSIRVNLKRIGPEEAFSENHLSQDDAHIELGIDPEGLSLMISRILDEL